MNQQQTAARLRSAREAAGLSLDALAAKVGMSKTGLWDIENGRHDPLLSTAAKLAQALSVSLDWLAYGENPPALAAVQGVVAKVREALGGPSC